MSPKQQRGEATVERLLTTALRVYADSGRHGFTVNAVTAAGGVSLGSLYHHFGSFDGLAAALYIRCTEQLHGEVVTALGRTRTARTGVRAMVTAYLRFTEEHPDAALFIHASAHSGHLVAHADRVRAAEEPLLAAIGEWMRPLVEAGEIAPIPEPLVEALIIGPAAETACRWLSGAHDVDLAQAARVLPDRIWRSLRPE
ncbi:TetR/AcrR family transcriptional regulator [Streptomyces sp. NBC_00250]|uniref:TetR/AcrR family transcriptional regulator n=1 Tax=Streptomyces sp. NBC_00250 TaxID=2903641 RepID=UPI002E281491|nr:TetR/AcrR family transcriptional regulator [Streptomyces sp. NBC_00250]